MAAGRHAAGLLVHSCHTFAAAVIMIPRRITIAAARRSDYVGMRLHGDGPARRNAEATEMTVLSTSDAVPLKTPWRPTDAGQMPDPSHREHLGTAPVDAFARTSGSSWYYVAFCPQSHGPPGPDFSSPR